MTIQDDFTPFNEPIPKGCIPNGRPLKMICDYDYYETGDPDRINGCGGIYYQRSYTTPAGWMIIDRTPCRCMLGIMQQKEQEKAAVNLKDRKENFALMVLHYFESYDLLQDPVYNQMTLTNYKPNHPSQHVALDQLQQFSYGADSILLYGDAGLGKTHLALGVAKVAKEKGAAVLGLKAIDLLTRIKRSYGQKDESAEINIMRILKHIDLLVIDDIGLEKTTDWALSKFYEVIDYRHRRKSTVFTTNLTGGQMREKEGVAIVSRIWGSELRLEIEGKDRRIAKTISGCR